MMKYILEVARRFSVLRNEENDERMGVRESKIVRRATDNGR